MPPATAPSPALPRPRRSVLYVPGSSSRAIDKARRLPVDGVILDLEDAVAPDTKPAARDAVARALADGGWGPREVAIRVNALETPWGRDDLAMAAETAADAVLLPKVDGPEMLRAAHRVLAEAGAPGGLPLWAMMETAAGVMSATAIAGATPRLAALVIGTADLAKELHARHLPAADPLATARSLCLLAARARGLAILDGVHLELDDVEGFEVACRQGAAMGFDGKTLIHPRQVDPANAAFSPAPAALNRARRIIDAHRDALATGRGVTVVDGRLVERLHVVEAERLVALAERIAEAERAQAAEAQATGPAR